MGKRLNGLDFFTYVSCIIIILMFTVSTFFIIFQSLYSIKAYNEVNSICFAQLSELKEYYTASITQEIYSLIYSFMSTAIVGLGAYILKKNNDTKNKIKQNIEELSEKQYYVAKKQLERDISFNILVSNISISHQYVSAIKINNKNFADLEFYSFIESIKTTKESLCKINDLSKEQQDLVLNILYSIKNKLEILTHEGIKDPKNDEGKTAFDYLIDSINIVENMSLTYQY